jgi:hypothetical protein
LLGGYLRGLLDRTQEIAIFPEEGVKAFAISGQIPLGVAVVRPK